MKIRTGRVLGSALAGVGAIPLIGGMIYIFTLPQTCETYYGRKRSCTINDPEQATIAAIIIACGFILLIAGSIISSVYTRKARYAALIGASTAAAVANSTIATATASTITSTPVSTLYSQQALVSPAPTYAPPPPTFAPPQQPAYPSPSGPLYSSPYGQNNGNQQTPTFYSPPPIL